jgi:hypothetical protein
MIQHSRYLYTWHNCVEYGLRAWPSYSIMLFVFDEP